MIINKNSWHYKWFMKYVLNKYTHNGRYGGDFDSSMTMHVFGTLTLCTYVKAVLIYAPIRYIWTNEIMKLLAINTIILLVVYAELVSHRFNTHMFLFTTTLIGVLVLTGFILFGVFYGEHIKGNVKLKLRHTSEKVKNISFMSVLKSYYKAKKEKICPFIKFEE